MNLLTLIPFLSAAILGIIAGGELARRGRPRLGFVVAILPVIGQGIDVFVPGNLTDFRQMFAIVYNLALLWVINYNEKRGEL